jgi:ankyrin repeat protein
MAASMGRTEAVNILLSRGADAKIRDRNGHSALDRAHESGFTDSEKALRQALKPTTASRR